MAYLIVEVPDTNAKGCGGGKNERPVVDMVFIAVDSKANREKILSLENMSFPNHKIKRTQ